MSKQSENVSIKCVLRVDSTRCFCNLDNGNCWDFNDIMEAIYSISRDKLFGSVPNGAFKNSEHGPQALQNISSILNLLHKYSFDLSKSLFDQSSEQLDDGFQSNCYITDVSEKDVEKLINREDIGIKEYPNGIKCLQFFSRGTRNIYNQSKSVLRIREKLIQQIDSCETQIPNKTVCELLKLRDILPQTLELFHEFANSKHLLGEKKVDLREAKYYLNWNSNEMIGNKRTRGIVFAWIIAGFLLFSIVMIARSSCSYEPIEERKPLNPQEFKLKDIEKELKIALLGKKPEKSLMTIQAKKNLSTPREESDLGSSKNRSKLKQEMEQQQDMAEFIPHLQQPKKRNPRIPSGERNEKSIISKTDQGSVMKKRKSDESVAMKSIKKTQSLSSPEHTALSIEHPRVQRTPRPRTPIEGVESKRTKRKKSGSRPKSPGSEYHGKKSKEKTQWFRFWS
uniref:Uncharacterized protein n=2 Tax=Caenorhabditis tropicalis TaxID=1561998 RepID=A0A1I7TFA4_9PELO